MKPLRICIDARLISGTAGGVEQVVIGLASGMAGLTDGDEEYYFLAFRGADEWIRPYVSGPCQMIYARVTPEKPRWMHLLTAKAPIINKALNKCRPVSEHWNARMLMSDGTIEQAGIDIMHFTHQVGFRTRVASIYHPHDIQHLHQPQFFSPAKRLIREVLYRSLCRQASVVPVVSSWMRREIIRHYRLPQEKVCVVPFAPPLEAYPDPKDEDMQQTAEKFSLPDSFIYYPAKTWPHKNHLKLIEALAVLRDRKGLTMPFVSSGGMYEGHFPAIKARVEELGMQDQVKFVGFVSSLELQCLYKLCRAVVIPTLYEAASFPLWEAFSLGAPAACSNVTSLPEIAGDAAIIFDPNDVESIASAVARLWTDGALREELALKGRANVGQLSWDRTARIFRAHYRRLANRSLTQKDCDILESSAIYEASISSQD